MSRKTNQLVTLLTNISWCQEWDMATPMVDTNVELSCIGSNSKLAKNNLKNTSAGYILTYNLKFEWSRCNWLNNNSSSSHTRNKINKKLICQGVNHFLQIRSISRPGVREKHLEQCNSTNIIIGIFNWQQRNQCPNQ